jgi:hypothetical protein
MAELRFRFFTEIGESEFLDVLQGLRPGLLGELWPACRQTPQYFSLYVVRLPGGYIQGYGIAAVDRGAASPKCILAGFQVFMDH